MNRGFSLLELLLVIALLIFLVGLTLPISLYFFQTILLDKATITVIDTLRRAQLQAMLQKNDSSFGVKIFPGAYYYVLFQGDSYDSRVQNEDEYFFVWGDIEVVSGRVDELVFSKFTGTPSITGTVYVTLGNNIEGININSEGKIERQ